MKLVADTLGNFIKFYVSLPQLNQTDQSASTESAPCRNAFDIMMAAQREKMSHVLPDKIAVRNKKDQLFNDLVTMIGKVSSGSHQKLTTKKLTTKQRADLTVY